jgi:hypothetical protein
MSNYAKFIGFENCKFSKPALFDYKKWVSVNYFLCDNDDPNFRMHKDIPEGYRLPNKQEFEALVKEHPFFVKQKLDHIHWEYETKEYSDYYKKPYMQKHNYDLDVYTFKNDLGLEVSVAHFNDNASFDWGPICLVQEGYEEYMKEYNKSDEYTPDGKSKYWNPVKDDCKAWYGDMCFDIAQRKYYEDFDYRVPRCMILIKDPNKYELLE